MPALLTSGRPGIIAYLDADLRDPGAILAGAAEILYLSRPVAVMLLAILITSRTWPGHSGSWPGWWSPWRRGASW